MSWLYRVIVRSSVAAASWQVFVIQFFFACFPFFFYHEALSTIPQIALKAFAEQKPGRLTWAPETIVRSSLVDPLVEFELSPHMERLFNGSHTIN